MLVKPSSVSSLRFFSVILHFISLACLILKNPALKLTFKLLFRSTETFLFKLYLSIFFRKLLIVIKFLNSIFFQKALNVFSRCC